MDDFRLIPTNEYQPDLEDKVRYYVSITPDLPKNTVKPRRAQMPPTKDALEEELWQREEIRRCREGHFGYNGKFYFWYNYCKIWDIERGAMFLPDFRVCQAEWFRQIKDAQDSKEWGLVCVKRRRVGASWLEAADVLHDCLFYNPGGLFKAGMTSKTEDDAKELFKKVKFIYDNLPIWMKATTSAGNTATSLVFGWKEKDARGNWMLKGLQSEIKVKAPTETGWEGFALRKWCCDEAGKILGLKQLFSYANDTMMIGNRRVGTPVVFGTAGDIGKEGKDFKDIWYNADVYKLRQFFFGGWMGLAVDEFGNDRKEDAIRWIVYERKRLESLSQKEYNDFLQKYPLTVQEAFTSNEAQGLGNAVKINKQIGSLYENPVKIKRGFFKLDANKRPVFVPSFKGQCLIYEEPDPSFNNLYIGGCLPPGERVMTQRGLIPVEEVTLYDKLINEKGQLVEITKLLLYDVVNEPTYAIKTTGTLTTTTFTKEHPILVSERTTHHNYSKFNPACKVNGRYYSFDFKYKLAENVKVGEWIKVPNTYRLTTSPLPNNLWDNKGYRVDRRVASPLNSPDFWWMVGLYLGDGWLSKHKVYFAIDAKEQLTLERLLRTLKLLFGRSPYKRLRGGCYEVSIGFSQLSDFLSKHFGKYAHGKTIPEWFKYAEIPHKTALIGGFLDSDGCVTLNKKRGTFSTEFVSINQALLEHIQDILFSLNVVSSLTLLRPAKKIRFTNRTKLSTVRACYHLRVSHANTLKLKQLLGPGQKTNKIVKDITPKKTPRGGCYIEGDFIYFQIQSIECQTFTGVVRNFECDTHTFMCRHITTHNCDPTDSEVQEGRKDVSSLALFIMKKRHGVDAPKIVFEYVDRPPVPRDFYDQALLACLYFNEAKLMVEKNKPGIITYFDEAGYKYLLATKPNSYERLIMNNTWNIGYYLDKKTTMYAEELVAEYIEDHCDIIPSKGLLEECINYGITNTDRVSAFFAVLLLLKEDKWEAKIKGEASNIPGWSYVRGSNGIPVRVSKGMLQKRK